MLNTQASLPRDDYTSSGHHLLVHSIFPTIQGEGPFTGRRATFVRLYGCNLQCPGCDTEYTSVRQAMFIGDVLEEVYKHPADLVVVTGGEPFRQNLNSFLPTLALNGFTVQVETNGTLFHSQLTPGAMMALHCAHLVVSPKTHYVNEHIAAHASAFKYVLSHDSIDPEDGLPIAALDNRVNGRLARPPEGYRGPVYVMPRDTGDATTNRKNLEAARDTCLRHGYTLGVQLHKLIGVD